MTNHRRRSLIRNQESGPDQDRISLLPLITMKNVRDLSRGTNKRTWRDGSAHVPATRVMSRIRVGRYPFYSGESRWPVTEVNCLISTRPENYMDHESRSPIRTKSLTNVFIFSNKIFRPYHLFYWRLIAPFHSNFFDRFVSQAPSYLHLLQNGRFAQEIKLITYFQLIFKGLFKLFRDVKRALSHRKINA